MAAAMSYKIILIITVSFLSQRTVFATKRMHMCCCECSPMESATMAVPSSTI